MRLKYYLRGLGTGIAVTAVILTIAGNLKDKNTDKERPTAGYGVVVVETTSGEITTEDVENTTGESITSENTTEEYTSESEKTTSEHITQERTTEAEKTTEEHTTREQTTETEKTTEEHTTREQTTEAEKTTAEHTTQERTTEAEKTTVEPATEEESAEATSQLITVELLNINNSYTAASKLYNAGIIADADDFNNYLAVNGYARKIIDGTYELSSAMSYEEIAKIITRSR